MPKKYRILEPNHVIGQQPGRYIGWPTVALTRDNELIVAFSGDRDAHICPFGKSFIIRSRDNGKTWTAPELVNDTPLDDRDTGLLACSDGTLVISWFASHYTDEAYLGRLKDEAKKAEYRAQLQKVTKADIQRWAGLELVNQRYTLGHWTRRSTDGGRTWEDPVRVPPTAPHGPVELSDGRLMFVGNSNESLGRDPKRGAIVAAESRDKGLTWQVVGKIPMYPPDCTEAPSGVSYLCEAHVVEASPNHLVTMIRYEEIPRPTDKKRSFLWQSDSFDAGRTWTDPRRTSILGKPPHLTRLRDGRILVTYGYRHLPYGERACISNDGGKTWDYANEIILCDDAPSSDLGYPSSVQLADGTIYTVYYQQARAGEKPSVMAMRWAIED